jgi:NET1-associated nuclear protein 1 (U3 small nucleolar RNA-associated protein 17)
MVSTAGSLYALRLGDNSVIILSTSDLEARANITGIQADTLDFTTPAVEKLGQDYSVERTLFDSHLFHRTPSVISPTRPCLLLAVPSDQDHNQKGSPYLQTFEYFSGRSISRQAIARTNATVKQIGGDLNTIYEPTVYLIKSTPDGNWLATVDLWIPPKASSCSDEKFPISSRREMYLKFWKRDQKTQEWELVTRVDAPHNAWDSDHEPGLVLDMAANPHKAEFATIGEDGTVKIWRPKVRTQNGLVIRASKMDEGLWTWSCRKFVHLNQPFDVDESNLTSSASLTYSEDASTLAACYQHGGSRDPCSVHFIQTLNGDIRFSRTGLVKGSPLAMGFLNRYLILLSEDIIVWDVVDDCLQYGFKLPSHMNNLLGPASTHLAIDYVNKSFAVALPIHMKLSTANAHQSAQIAVFSPEQPTPQFHTESPHPITALHFNPSNRGYLAIDAAAEIRHIVPKVASISEFSNALAVEPDVGESHSALRILYTELELPDQSLPHTEDGDQETLGRRNAVQDEDDDGPPIVRKEQLAEIFDVGPAFALPSVDKLFNQVAGLYIGQTKA